MIKSPEKMIRVLQELQTDDIRLKLSLCSSISTRYKSILVNELILREVWEKCEKMH